ncbi:helix-turn-helix domain-containing protein [Agarivorans sp. QJM3NY_25]|uniref:helix-turn-helix domain-containing protein n=1 Tax=Agarivorans sp. QJM3NY_25 TaxID=3421430 RepID=UPI003D7D87B3
MVSPLNLQAEISLTQLLLDTPMQDTSIQNQCRLLRCKLQPGIDLFIWQSQLVEPFKLRAYDDLGMINFTCALNGQSEFSLKHEKARRRYQVSEGANCISFTPGCHGTALYQGQFESLVVAVQPRILEQWGIDPGAVIQAQLKAQCCFLQSPYHREIQTTAALLKHKLLKMAAYPPSQRSASSLWLLGHSIIFVSLMLEQYQQQTVTGFKLTQQEQQKLQLAKELLLADLTKAPSISSLASETGLSVLKIKRGFRLLFENSVYGLFQVERMKEAKKRLSAGNVQVLTVASDLGYVNASHFSSAFYKQFGVNPSTYKRSF